MYILPNVYPPRVPLTLFHAPNIPCHPVRRSIRVAVHQVHGVPRRAPPQDQIKTVLIVQADLRIPAAARRLPHVRPVAARRLQTDHPPSGLAHLNVGLASSPFPCRDARTLGKGMDQRPLHRPDVTRRRVGDNVVTGVTDHSPSLASTMPYSFTRPDGPVPPDLAVLAGLDHAVRLPLVLKELDWHDRPCNTGHRSRRPPTSTAGTRTRTGRAFVYPKPIGLALSTSGSSVSVSSVASFSPSSSGTSSGYPRPTRASPRVEMLAV